MTGMLLEAAVPEDALALAELERRCHTHPWPARSFADALAEGSPSRVLVLREPGAADAGRGIVAYCVLQLVVDELHIHNLAVKPESRRRGHARWLLGEALAWGAELGARVGYLEVREGNWPALALYRAAGFETVSVRRDYYENPREDALVLRKGALLHS
jgi:ribosomal-protein-alanine N-acetyltransferase